MENNENIQAELEELNNEQNDEKMYKLINSIRKKELDTHGDGSIIIKYFRNKDTKTVYGQNESMLKIAKIMNIKFSLDTE